MHDTKGKGAGFGDTSLFPILNTIETPTPARVLRFPVTTIYEYQADWRSCMLLISPNLSGADVLARQG